MVSWLFQANSKYSQILEAIQKLDGIYWLVTRYTKEIAPGDRFLIWIAGKQAGIYAIAEISVPPRFMDEPPDIDIWTRGTTIIGTENRNKPVMLINKGV